MQQKQDKKVSQIIEQFKLDTNRERNIINNLMSLKQPQFKPKEKRFFDGPKKTFLNPKEEYKVKYQSKAKNQFLQNYKNFFMVDGKNTINEDSNKAVSRILYQQLNASALSSRKWSNYSAFRRMLSLTPMSPELEDYPHDNETLKSLSECRRTITRNTKQCQSFNIQEVKKTKLKHFLENCHVWFNQNESVYQTENLEYNEVLSYLKEMKYGNLLDKYRQIGDAEDEVKYIKSRGRELAKQKQATIIHNSGSITTIEAQPNKVPQTNIIIGKRRTNSVTLRQKERKI